MTPSKRDASPPKGLARFAVAGMALAVMVLGALALWSALVAQDGASGLSQAGVQTAGHLRAVQALSLVDTQADLLEEETNPGEVEKLRGAQRVLDDGLDRMQTGGVLETSRIAKAGQVLVDHMKPAVDEFLVTRRTDDDRAARAEEDLEEDLTELLELLNDLDADPSRLLAAKLESVSDTGRTVHVTALVLIPLGLGGVAACALMLSRYRRRSEAVLLSALDRSAHEARTDQLTGLPNRRALLEALDERSHAGKSFTLVLADLNGFKRYNDTFGHPAGDALLRRLGRRLAAACEGRGMAARLGGDEFCVMFFATMPADEVHTVVGEALSDEGEGFHITASTGVAAVPEEASDPTAALRLADSRMYAAKVSGQPSAEQGISISLTRMLDERHPGLGTHGENVAELATATAEALGLSGDEIRTVERAAELHDIGKVGIPTDILTLAGPLSGEASEFMRRHSVIGERILASVPTLDRVASLVRSAHERWDGDGYPDRLAGEAIPLGARIIGVADAFCAMTANRPYAQARSIETAYQELLACSGAQFDPAVVTAVLAVLRSRDVQATSTVALVA